MIIGVTGTQSSGKSTIIENLKEKGFKHYSIEDSLIREIERKEMPLNKNSILFIRDEIRRSQSPDYLVTQILNNPEIFDENVVIEEIRSTAEAQALKEKDNSFLFSIDASPFLRYERKIERDKKASRLTYAEFLSQDQREYRNENPIKDNLQECMQLADFHFTNEGTYEDLKKAIERTLEKINFLNQIKPKRPTWDEYFLGISNCVARRATCEMENQGALIVKNNHILSTGYTGVASHFPPSKEKKDEIHAEQNAICQAARFGVSIEDSTLYTKTTPCYECTKLIINSGIKKIVCESKHKTQTDSLKAFEEADIQVEFLNQ